MTDPGQTQENTAERYRQKLITAKQKWAREGRLLVPGAVDSAERLPPGQRLVSDWPVLDLGVQPHVQKNQWQLEIDGEVETPLTWTWDDFASQPQMTSQSDIHCVTAWSRYDNVWNGVSTLHLCALVQPRESVRHVILHSYDGYTTNVALEVFTDDDCLLAHSHDGAPLTRQHGGPVRLVIPKYYFWKSAKWIKRIEFATQDDPGFWERRGYHNVGDPWQQQRYEGDKPEELIPD